MLKTTLSAGLLSLAILIQAQAPFSTTVLTQDAANFLRGVHFVTEDLGYAIDYNYMVIKTIDGAVNWATTKLPDVDARTEGIHFTDELTGYAVGYLNGVGERIYKTVDGGATWTTQVAGEGFDKLKHIDFFGNLGIAVGQGAIYRTVDGTNWTKFKPDPHINSQYVSIVNDQTIYVGGMSGNYYKSVDGGESWVYNESNAGDGYINAFGFFNENLGVAVGQNVIRKTTNGTDWTVVTPDIDQLFSATTVNDQLIIATGPGQWSGGDFGSTYGKLAYSTDQGDTWEVSYFEEVFGLLHDISFPTPNVGYAVGGPYIVKFEMLTNSTNEILIQKLNVFPNPARGLLHFEWPAEVDGTIAIRILDSNGKVLLHKEDTTDKIVDLAGFASGVYLLQLQKGKQRWQEQFVKQ